MTAQVLSYKPYGPYECIRTKAEASTVAELIGIFRNLFEDRVQAIAIVKEGTITSLMVAEPDVDCDQDGFYEVAPQHHGQEYVRYNSNHKSFNWSARYYFGDKYIASEIA